MSLPAGGTVTVEIACNKDFTSYGKKGDGKNACPTDSKSSWLTTGCRQLTIS